MCVYHKMYFMGRFYTTLISKSTNALGLVWFGCSNPPLPGRDDVDSRLLLACLCVWSVFVKHKVVMYEDGVEGYHLLMICGRYCRLNSGGVFCDDAGR